MADGEDLVYLDGVDLFDLSFYLLTMPGVWGLPEQSFGAFHIPHAPGVILSLNRPDVGAKVLVLQARGKFATTTAAQTAFDTLNDALTDRTVRISYAHATGRSYYGVLSALAVDHFAPLDLPGWVTASLAFLCADPYAVEDTAIVASGIAAERVAIEAGSGPSYLDVVVTGAATTPTVTLRDQAGNAMLTLANAANIAAGDCWHLSALDQLSEKVVTGVTTSNMGDLTITRGTGYPHSFPILLPRNVNRALSSWGTIETSSGTIAVTYAPRWQ